MPESKTHYRYALENPLAVLAGKPVEDLTRRDLLKIIEAKNIERITFHYTALDGKLKELKIPIASRVYAEKILANGERVDGSSLFAGMIDVALSDLYVVPLYKSAFINPFDERSLDFICRFVARDGMLYAQAPDTILEKANQLFCATTHLELHALGELEFYLLSSPSVRMYPGVKQRGYHNTAPFLKSGNIVDEMVHAITRITGAVKYAHSEVGFIENVPSVSEEINGKQAEQVEIEFLPAPINDAADYLVLAKWLIRNIAYQHGCIATFAPKLEDGNAGTGMHIHLAVKKDGKNIMSDENGSLSHAAQKAIVGLCTYANSLTAFGNTTAASYLRLVPNQEAPTRICWSDANRSAMIRVPLGWTKNSALAQKINVQEKEPYELPDGQQTVELRSPDGSALIHLLLAGIALAIEWGIANERSFDLAEQLYVTGNIFNDETTLKKLPTLPKHCAESSRILLANRNYYERKNIFPQEITEYVSKLLLAENDELLVKHLSELSSEQRMLEIRRIMHKDLHRH